MMDVKIGIGVIGGIIVAFSSLFLLNSSRKELDAISKTGLLIPILLSGPILVVISILIPEPDTLRHIVAVSLMDPISVLDLESYKEAVNTITQFIKETY